MVASIPLLFISLLSLTSTLRKPSKSSIATPSLPKEDTNIVKCWDNCFDASSLNTILAAGKSRSHGFPYIFDRMSNPDPSPLGTAIVSLLEQLEQGEEELFQKHRYVEYWWRDRVRMLEAHRDIDEDYCRKNQVPISLGSDKKFGTQRCPTFGHVLYVDVSEDCLAPTMVWQEKGGFQTGPPRELEKLFVVPAKSNRFLRFRGDSIHAVCHPSLAFLDSFKDTSDDNNKPKNSDQQRAVLLFNTWEEPPLHPPVGESLSRSADTRTINIAKKQSGWDPHKIVYNDRSHTGSRQTRLSVPLLGDASRRGCHQKSLDSMVDEKEAVTALTSKDSVSCLKLYKC